MWARRVEHVREVTVNMWSCRGPWGTPWVAYVQKNMRAGRSFSLESANCGETFAWVEA